MQDNETFELCKEVYRRTKWGDDDLKWWNFSDDIPAEAVGALSGRSWYLQDGDGFGATHPLYTSDYLLEKLPQQVKHYYFELVPGPVEETDNGWIARYQEPMHDGQFTAAGSDTPLKALLKLVITLDDAGVKLT